MHKIITFLGTAGPRDTAYSYEGACYHGRVFPEALLQFVGGFDRMLVFVTPQARQKTFDTTLGKLADDRIHPIAIPTGETTEEMWQTFTAVTGEVQEGDTVTFDITHGLRSIPFLVFLAAAFLKAARTVTIDAIYYGALELGRKDERPAPVVNLSPFVTLLDWIDASKRFIDLGDAGPLSKALSRTQPAYDASNAIAIQQRRQIYNAAKALQDVSLALRLLLPDQVMAASAKLEPALASAAEAAERYAKPFTVLAREVSSEYKRLALPEPRAVHNCIASLVCEREMVRWYMERGLIVQALAVAREWTVSWVMAWTHANLGELNLYDRKQREAVEKALGALVAERSHKDGKGSVEVCDQGILDRVRAATNDHPDARKLYDQLGNLRNTLLHAGKRLDVEKASGLEKKAREYCQEIQSLPLPDWQRSAP